MNKLVLQLDRMASKARRHAYQIGDYWNVCDEAAEEILRLERVCVRLREALEDVLAVGLAYGCLDEDDPCVRRAFDSLENS
jgi:hypothetical protein